VNGIAQSNPSWSRTSISGALSIMSICAGSISPVVGALLDRFGLIIVIPCSILLQMGGFMCLSQTQSIEMLYLSYIAVGFGHAGTANLGVGKAVGELFPGPDKGRVSV
jgi:MFS family permease